MIDIVPASVAVTMTETRIVENASIFPNKHVKLLAAVNEHEPVLVPSTMRGVSNILATPDTSPLRITPDERSGPILVMVSV